MNEKRPYIITFIGDISILSALLSIVVVLFPKFMAKFGFHMIPIPIFSEGIISILLLMIFLIASCGFLRLKIWGYWLMLICSIFFLVVHAIWFLQNKQLYYMNFAFTVIELIFIIPTRHYFDKKISKS